MLYYKLSKKLNQLLEAFVKIRFIQLSNVLFFIFNKPGGKYQ